MSNTLTNPDKVVTEERLLDFYQGIFPYLGGMPEAVLINGDLSIGTIVYKDGSTVPDGWLLCDGSTKNISAYPDLANYFQAQHGSKNYYGGNGSSTFGLPTYRRMPGNTVDEWSATEKVIGMYIDEKPMYQKIVNFGTLPNGGPKTVAHGISNISKTASCTGIILDSTGVAAFIPYCGGTGPSGYQDVITLINDKTNITIGTGTTRSSFSAYVILKYTKTTDSTVPAGYSPDRKGIWIIKAKTMIAEDYSTTEKIVGTWIDGKPIYQKTINVTLPSSTGTETYTNIGVSVDKVIGQRCAFYKDGLSGAFGHNFITSSTFGTTNSGLRVITYANASSSNKNTINVKNENANSWGGSGCSLYVTLQYTKTS